VTRLLAPAAPIHLVADDSLFKRSGRKVFRAAWHYDAAASGRKRTAWGNNWVVVGSWWACRLCPTGRCACRCLPACGSPASPAAASSTWPASWSGWCATATRTGRAPGV